MPAVSGSSGRLVVERIRSRDEEPHWPGQVFGEADLDYEEAMLQYVEATRDRLVHRRVKKTLQLETSTRWRKKWEERDERYQVRQQRQQEDIAWKAAKAQWRETRFVFQTLSGTGHRKQKATYEDAKRAWQLLRQQRQDTMENRKRENLAWHQRNQTWETELPRHRLRSGLCDRNPRGYGQLHSPVCRFTCFSLRLKVDQCGNDGCLATRSCHQTYSF